MSINPYASNPVIELPEDSRVEFVRKTYQHLAGAIGVFIALEAMMLQAGLGDLALSLLGAIPYSWLIVLGAFMIVGWFATRLASNAGSLAKQYVGLGLYVLAEALIFLPIMALAIQLTGSPVILGQAGVITGFMVLGLTAVAFTTKKDFTFLGGFLKIGLFVALGLIVASFFLPITLGLWFSGAMILLASGAILYDTSRILYHYSPGQHVAASLQIFASVALLFWYVLRLLMSLRE